MSFQTNSDGVLRLNDWGSLPWLAHGFTTRHTGDFGIGIPNGEKIAKLEVDGLRLMMVRQVHSDEVRFLGDAEAGWDPANRPQGDALVTAQAGCLLAVRTADCVPLLLVDPKHRAIAAVHAGWRGTHKQVARRAVETMQERFSTNPEDLEAAVGPGIESCCFEVGPEVAELFDPSLVISPPAATLPGFPGRSLRPHIDLVEANRRQLLEQGVQPRNIWSVRRCTCCGPQDFFSYRRDGDAAGRMLAFIGIKPA